MNLIQALNMPNCVVEIAGKTTNTTFPMDFAIAEATPGNIEHSILDTYQRAKTEWLDSPPYAFGLACSLNHACWRHYGEGNMELSALYDRLYKEFDQLILEHYRDNDDILLAYYDFMD